MGVEPTAARSARPASDFEDRGSHRTTTIPGRMIMVIGESVNWLISKLVDKSISRWLTSPNLPIYSSRIYQQAVDQINEMSIISVSSGG